MLKNAKLRPALRSRNLFISELRKKKLKIGLKKYFIKRPPFSYRERKKQRTRVYKRKIYVIENSKYKRKRHVNKWKLNIAIPTKKKINNKSSTKRLVKKKQLVTKQRKELIAKRARYKYNERKNANLSFHVHVIAKQINKYYK